MAKTITTTVTLHVKDVKRSRKFRYDQFGALISGRHVVIEVPPGKPVQFEDEAEADGIIDRFGGEVVDIPPHAVSPAKEDEVDEEAESAPTKASKKTAPAV